MYLIFQIEHTFKGYQAGVRYVWVCHAGKDRQYWAGHYGPKITGTSIIMNVTEECEKNWKENTPALA